MTFQCMNCNTSFEGFPNKNFVFTCAHCGFKDEISQDWRDNKPTHRQLSYLKILKYAGTQPLTRGEASDILDRLNKPKHRSRIQKQAPKHRSRIHKQPQNHPITTSQDRFGEIDSAIQTALVRITFDEKELSLAQQKVNMYLSDGFRIDRLWEYGSDYWDTKGKVLVLTRGGTTFPNEPIEDCIAPFAETAFIRVSFDELTSEHHTSTSAMDLAQEKINIYLSDGFEFWRTYPVVAEGQQIGRIVWLGKTQEERTQ